MAAATATASIVPTTVAQDIATLETGLEGQTGITSVVDPGAQNIVSVDAEASDAGTPAVWIIDLGGADGGNYAIAVDGLQTANIAFNADDATIKAAIEALDNVTTVTVSAGLADGDVSFGDPVRDVAVTFVDVDLTNAIAPGITEGTAGVAPSAVTAAAVISDAVTAQTECVVLGDIATEVDPVLSSPSDVALDISDGDTEEIKWSVTLNRGARLVSIDLDYSELTAVVVPVAVYGDPGAHQSRALDGETIRLVVGPAPAGADTGSPHNILLSVTDSNGRTSAVDVVAVTVAA